MSNLGATLSKQVGPLPMGVWLLLGGGGLFFAYRNNKPADAPAPAGDPLPTGGGTTGSWDGAPVVLSPIIQVPAPVVLPNTSTPKPTPTPTPTTKPPASTPTVPTPGKPKPPAPAKTTTSYTVRAGDTLYSIAARLLGSGLRWPAVYAENKATIDAAAKAHGKPGGGHWIFPGTVLRVTR